MPDLLNAALELAVDGVEVFPLDGRKRPRSTHGFHDATCDESTIRLWNWNGDGAIGAAIPDGQFVVDIDPRNGGNDTIRALSDRGLKLPMTKAHRTKGGGLHKFYSLPVESRDMKLRGTVGPGVDIKKSGKGYVVYPPSPGYSVLFDAEVVPAPPWLLDEILVEVKDSEASQGSPPKFFKFQTGTAYGSGAMDRELEQLSLAVEGERNNRLNKSAYSLAQLCAGGEVSEESAINGLMLEGVKLGLEEDEIQQTIKSGWEAGFDEPRQAPARVKEYAEDHGQAFADEGSVDSTETPHVKALEDFRNVRIDDGEYWLNWDVEEPPPPFYLYPLVPKNAYILVYGATESSKSITFMALAAQASHRGIKTSIYSLENPSHIERDRLRRLKPDGNNLRLTKQPLDVFDMRQLNELIERNRAGGHGSWQDGKSTDLLIIDTYSHALYSNSEDGNEKAIQFAIRIRYAMDQIGCSAIVLDHTGYQDHGEPRGASAKRQQVDVALHMEKSGIWVPNSPSKFTIANKKSARFSNPCFLRGEIMDVRPDERGLELRWLVSAGEEEPRWE